MRGETKNNYVKDFLNFKLTKCTKRQIEIDIRSKIRINLFPLFMSYSIKDFLSNFFDLCREYQEKIPPKKIAEVLRDYADRLDG